VANRAYNNWIKAYVSHTRFSESPDAFHFWTGVATVAGALRRRVWIDERHFQWTPNFYIVLVGPPGVAAKSTSIRSGISLLERVPGVYLGPQSMTWQALTESLQNAQECVEIPGRPEPEPMSCISIGVSELGTFLKPDDSELVDVLVDMWDGQKTIWRRRTKTQGETTIHNPWLNVIACTTPAWLKENFPDVLVGGGLTSRMVFVFADKKRQLVAYPSELINSSDYKEEEEYLLHDLFQIAELCGEYTLTSDAREWGREWYKLHWTTARTSHMASERFAGYFSRKQTHLHKLAMVLAAAKRNELVIEAEDLMEANTLITDLEVDMQHVFSSIGVSHSARVSSELLALIRNAGSISLQKLWQLCFATMASKDFTEAVKASVEAGYVKVTHSGQDRILNYCGPKVISPVLQNSRRGTSPVSAAEPPALGSSEEDLPPV
jgi:hypothetical protein